MTAATESPPAVDVTCDDCLQTVASMTALRRHVFMTHTDGALVLAEILRRFGQATSREIATEFERTHGFLIHPSTVSRRLRPLVADPGEPVWFRPGRFACYYWQEPGNAAPSRSRPAVGDERRELNAVISQLDALISMASQLRTRVVTLRDHVLTRESE